MLAYVLNGANYTVTTCGNAGYDTQLTVYDDATGTFLAYNDDDFACGVYIFNSTLSFTPSFCGWVRILLDQYPCSASGTPGFVIMTQNTPASNLPSLTPASDMSACAGGTVLLGISGNGTGGTAPYTYSWSPATNLSSTTTSQTTATVTATQTYTLTLTDALGCPARDTVTATMLPAPTVNLGPDVVQCGGTVLLDAGNFGSTYLWNTGAGTQTLNVTTSGNYAVSVQDPSGCVNSDNINITINPVPTVDLGSDTSICGNSLMLDAGTGFTTYAWSTGGSAQTENVATSGNIYVDATDANGCLATDSIMVTLNPAPVVNLGPDVVQCGGTVLLDAGNPGALYFWSNSTSSQTTTISSSGSYSVQVITPAGCTASDQVNITINNQPVVDLGPDTTTCSSTATLDAGNPGCAYLWSNAATTQTVNAAAGTWIVRVTDPSGCVDRDTIVVTTNNPPPVSAGMDTSICANGSATLTASGGLSYVWSTGATTQSIVVTPNVQTTYYVTGTDANGCTASDVVNVTVLSNSNAQFTSNVIGATAYFTNQSTNAFTYSWNFGDASPLDNSANPAHTYTVNGTYVVTLTVTGPCGVDTYTMNVVITQVGLQDQDLANTMSLFPNPNDGNFTLAFELTKAKSVNVEILDVAGRIVYNKDYNNITRFNEKIGIENADNGMYVVRIITDEGVVTEKIVVQK
jgi:hypothetical protein